MIVIVTFEDYPDGSAGAIRCKSFANAYTKFGYEVTVIHKGQFEKDVCPRVISCYDANKYKKYFCFERNVISHLNKLQKDNTIEAVLFYRQLELYLSYGIYGHIV